jgi:cytidylate kinase
MLSNAERKKLVLDLYNQGKTIRQIAKEARMSFRDINTVLKKAAASLESEYSKKQSDESSSNGKATEIVVDKATQAFKLFTQLQKPIEVSWEQRKQSDGNKNGQQGITKACSPKLLKIA